LASRPGLVDRHSRDELETFAPRIGYPVWCAILTCLAARQCASPQHADLIDYLRTLGAHLRKQPI